MISNKIKLNCDYPGCESTFSDPSSRTKHRQNVHELYAQSNAESSVRSASRRKKKSAPYSVPVHALVQRHVEENSGENAPNVLGQFYTFAVEVSSSNATTPLTTPSCSSGPPSDHEP